MTLAAACAYETLGDEDREAVERQLGRPLRGRVTVASRCPYGTVEVICTPPMLPGGTPFPTLFWLTCPLLHRSVSGLEGGGFRESLYRKAREAPGFAGALRKAEKEYQAERERWAEEEGAKELTREYFSGRGGVGGTVAGGLKCLHAHLAHFLAGRENPVGAEVAEALSRIQESDCAGDCEPFLRGERRR